MAVTWMLDKLCGFFIVVICVSNADISYPTWKVSKKVMKYGEDLSLYCKVKNCCLESAGWIKWTSENEFTTIFIDVKDITVAGSSKYNGKINENGFFLVMRNITRQDLNVYYSCTYGFQVSEKKILLETDAIFAKTQIEDGASSNDEHYIPDLTWVAIAVCAFCLVLGTIIAICCKSRINNAIHKVFTNNRHDEQLQTSTTDQAQASQMLGYQPVTHQRDAVFTNNRHDEQLQTSTTDQAQTSPMLGYQPVPHQRDAGDFLPISPCGFSQWPAQTLNFADLQEGEIKLVCNQKRQNVEKDDRSSDPITNENEYAENIHKITNEIKASEQDQNVHLNLSDNRLTTQQQPNKKE